jgi:hypothetical protein
VVSPPTRLLPCEVAVYWDVKTVKPLPNYRIYVEIEDGRKGIFDLKPYLDRGVFRELRNVHYFNQVSILFGAVTWPNEQDIAPETLLAEMLPVEQTTPAGNRNVVRVGWVGRARRLPRQCASNRTYNASTATTVGVKGG